MTEFEKFCWHDGYPPPPYDREWFIAETVYDERVVLKKLDQLNAHDFTTADHTWMMKECIKRWMQFPDSEYVAYVRKEMTTK